MCMRFVCTAIRDIYKLFHVVYKRIMLLWGFWYVNEQQQIYCELFIRNYTWLDDGWMFLYLNKVNGKQTKIYLSSEIIIDINKSKVSLSWLLRNLLAGFFDELKSMVCNVWYWWDGSFSNDAGGSETKLRSISRGGGWFGC